MLTGGLGGGLGGGGLGGGLGGGGLGGGLGGGGLGGGLGGGGLGGGLGGCKHRRAKKFSKGHVAYRTQIWTLQAEESKRYTM